MYAAWDCILAQTERMAKVRLELADLILSAVTDPMKEMAQKKDDARKKVLILNNILL